MAAASTFSYAQAAKGQGSSASPATSSNATAPSESAPSVTTDDKSSHSAQSSTDVPDPVPASDAASSVGDKPGPSSVAGSEINGRSEVAQEKRSESKKDEEVSRLDRPWRRNDKGIRSSSATTRSEDHESRRPRKGKKGKSSDKQNGDNAASGDKVKDAEPEPPKIPLSEAPLPSVNIWQQRKEQRGGPAPAETSTEETSNGNTHSNQPKPEESSTVRTNVPSQVNGIKKPIENTRPARGFRPGGKERDRKTEIPPPVADASLWPTVDTAVQEDKKKTTDKPDVPRPETRDSNQEEGSASKARSKEKWVAYDYVPTVQFETALPQIRGSKPRGGAKGTSSSRAAAPAQTGEKPSTATVPETKPVESASKPREGSNGISRPTPTLPAQKRASIEVPSTRTEYKKSSVNTGEKIRDPVPHYANEHTQPPREGRNERGRGGYRGRGGHHTANSHGHHQHTGPSMNAPAFTPSGSMPSRSQAPYSSPPRGGHGQGFVPPPTRGGRGGRGGNNYHRAMANGSRGLPPVQTQYPAPNFDYGVQPMSGMAFQSPGYWDQSNNMVINMLRQQIEYYFSVENLCKDIHLRRHMDGQGFVELHFISGFKRMKDLSPDSGATRFVCEISDVIDFVVGDDGIDRLRPRENWAAWVMPKDERDQMARNNGPAKFSIKSRAYQPFANQYPPVAYNAMSPSAHLGQAGQPFQPMDEQYFGQGMNGMANGTSNGHTQLSAAVPDFSPSLLNGSDQGFTNGHAAPAVNGVHSGSDQTTES